MNKSLLDYLPKQMLSESAELLHVGDPVIITGPVQFKGSTGEIRKFNPNKSFVVVGLYNHGTHSFHSSDVSYNRYADEDERYDEVENGDYVRYEGDNEVYVTSQCNDRRCWIADKQGRGWYAQVGRLSKVQDWAEIDKWFGTTDDDINEVRKLSGV